MIQTIICIWILIITVMGSAWLGLALLAATTLCAIKLAVGGW